MKEGTPLVQLILVAVVTAILTSLGTAFVDKSKISGEHQRWKKEQLIAYQQQELQEQTKLVQQLVESIIHLSRARNEFNYGFVYLVGVRILAVRGQPAQSPSDVQNQLDEVYQRYLKHWATVRGQFRHARTVFGSSVAEKLTTFDAYFTSERYLFNVENVPSVEASIKEALAKSANPFDDLERISHVLSMPDGHELLMKHANELLDEMEAELMSNRKRLLKNVLGSTLGVETP